jgi:hypothetical protein
MVIEWKRQKQASACPILWLPFAGAEIALRKVPPVENIFSAGGLRPGVPDEIC